MDQPPTKEWPQVLLYPTLNRLEQTRDTPDCELQILHSSLQKSVVSEQCLSHPQETPQHGSNNCNDVISDEHKIIGHFLNALGNNLDVLFKFANFEVISARENCSNHASPQIIYFPDGLCHNFAFVLTTKSRLVLWLVSGCRSFWHSAYFCHIMWWRIQQWIGQLCSADLMQ